MTNFYIGSTIPQCRKCHSNLIEDKHWRNFYYKKKRKQLYDNGCLKGREIFGNIYFRTICNKCFYELCNKPIPKFNIISYDFEILAEVPLNILKEYISKNRSVTLKNMIERYGEIEGKIKWEKYKKKQSYTNSKEYHMLVHNKSEEEWVAYNKNRSVTLKNMIERHGEDLGKLKWEEYINRQKYTESVEYMIEKFGEIEGQVKFIEKCSSKKNTYENMIKRHGEDLGKIKWEALLHNQKSGYSKMASSLFTYLEENIRKDFPKIDFNKIYYLPKNKEYCINTKDNKGLFYDFVITDDINLCIEFQGNVYHANPKYFKEQDIPIKFFHPDLTAKEIWEKDAFKKNEIEKRKFDVIIVWEEHLKIPDFYNKFYKTLVPYLDKRIRERNDNAY